MIEPTQVFFLAPKQRDGVTPSIRVFCGLSTIFHTQSDAQSTLDVAHGLKMWKDFAIYRAEIVVRERVE